MFRFFPSARAFATCVVALLLALFAYPALAGQASLAWNASASTNVTGYKVHYGMASASYATHVDVGNSLSATVPTLTPGATYYFAVTAYNSAGESGYSNEASATIPAADTQAPTVPSNPAAAANGSSAINLNWTGSTDNVGVAGYRVERCLGASCTSFAQVATPTSTSFADSGLTAGTTYRYRLRAVDAAGNLSGYSTAASASTSAAADTQAPTVPSNPAAAANGSSAINLNWTGSTDNVGVAGYRVERCLGASCTSFAQVATPTSTSFADSGLTAGTAYRYRLRAVDAAGNLSGYSTVASASTSAAPDTQAPTVPSNPAAAANGSSAINLNWTGSTDNVGVAGYQVERCLGASCTSFAQVATPTSTSFADSGLTAGTAYRYRLRAVDAAGNLSGYSTVASASTSAAPDTQAPTVPSNPAAAANGSSAINLNWTGSTDNVGVAGYRVERCLGASCTSFAQVATPTSTSFADSGLTAGTAYRYRLRAVDAAGNLSGYSAVASASTSAAPDTQAPTVPSNPAAAANGSSAINLNWTGSTDNVGVAGYQVERCLGASCTSFAQVATPTSTSFADSGLTAGTTYRYRLRAVDAAGNLSGYSTAASASTSAAADTQAPTVPSNPAAAANGSSAINLNWTGSTDNVGVAGYRVERCLGASCTSFAQVATPTSTSFADSGLTAGTAYRYRLRAVDAAGNLSGYSAVASASTSAAPDTQAPTVPSNPAAAANGSSAINLNWTGSTDNVGVAGYRVERCLGASCTSFAQVATPTSTSFADSGLTAGTAYRYRLRAVDAAGNLSGYSAVASASTSAEISSLAADFSANRTSGSAPMPVAFTEASSGTITGYAWTFGDGSTSTTKNPSHTYARAGTYSVSLSVTGGGGTKSITKSGYIKVGMDNDLVVDFGANYGIWQWLNNTNWAQLHGVTARQIAIADVDHNGQQDQVVDFGSRYGIWMRMNNASWTPLHWLSANWIVKADVDDNGQDDLVIDFGSRYGIWMYMNGSNWKTLHGTTAKQAIVADVDHNGRDDVVVDFGAAYGVWAYLNGTTWTRLDARSPNWMSKADVDHNGQDDLVMSFGAGTGSAQSYPGKGIWAYLNGSTWRQLDSRAVASTRGIAIDVDHDGQDDLVIDYGASGLWIYRNDTDWVQLHSAAGKSLAKADLDSNGQDDLVVDFGSRYGINVYMNGMGWAALHGTTASSVTPGQVDGQ